jgi:hypothetical protein
MLHVTVDRQQWWEMLSGSAAGEAGCWLAPIAGLLVGEWTRKEEKVLGISNAVVAIQFI